MRKFERGIVVAPTRATCVNIEMALKNGGIPPTLLMQERGEEIFRAVNNLSAGGFGIVAGTGTGKTVALRDILPRVVGGDLRVDVVTREHEATGYTWTCNTLVVTPGVACHWLKSGVITPDDLIVIDEIHQTSEHLELAMALAKRQGSTFLWMSATIDPKVYAEYLNAQTVINCSAFDPRKRSEVECLDLEPDDFLTRDAQKFIAEKRAVAMFVPTRAMAENLAAKFNGQGGLYCDFYHGGEKAEKLRQFLRGDVPKPFMIFMTIAGSSSLNILGLNTVVIVDEMYDEVVHSGVRVLEKVKLDNNHLLQMGGRVNGRTEWSRICILTSRWGGIDFHSLEPTAPKFVLGGDLRRVALTCARVAVNARDLDLIGQIDHGAYEAEVIRFKDRGVIESEGDGLTDYGQQVERLPVEPSWAEILVEVQEADDPDMLNIVSVCSCVESLYSLLRREDPDLKEIAVSGSDHLTSYNIVVSALQLFGYLRNSRGDGGLEYGLREDWIRKDQSGTQKGEFIEWCDKHGFNGKSIKEVLIAMKSVYRQLKLRLPEPEELWLVENGDEPHQNFLHLLAYVQALDFVQSERNSKAGQVWAAKSSQTTATRVLGQIRFWTDKRERRRATIEGTEIPADVLEQHIIKNPISVARISNEGVFINFQTSFAGEKLGSVCELVADADIPENLLPQARKKLVEVLVTGVGDLHPCIAHNQQIRSEAADLNRRVQGQLGTLDSSKLEAWYISKLGEVCVLSEAQKLNLNLTDSDVSAMLGIEDYARWREEIKAERPDSWMIAGEPRVLAYKHETWGFKGTEIQLPVSIIAGLDVSQLPSWEGTCLRVIVADEGYNNLRIDISSQTLDELRNKIEARRLDLAWKKFKGDGVHGDYLKKEEVPYGQPLPLMPEIEVWDQQNESEAYPAWVFYSHTSGENAMGTWYVRWYRTEDEAVEALAASEVKKAEVDAAEDERRNFSVLKAESQKLFGEVEGLWSQVNRKDHQLYGLSSREADPTDWGYSESLACKLSEAKTLAGLNRYDAKPRQALEMLKNIKARIETALAFYGENLKAEPEALEKLALAHDLARRVEGCVNQELLAWSEIRGVTEALEETQAAIDGKNFLKAVEHAKKVSELAEPLLAEADKKLAARQVINDFVAREYSACPVCAGELERNGSHWCQGQDGLRARGQGEDFVVKISKVGEAELVKLTAIYDRGYNEYELRLEVNYEILVGSAEEIKIELFWRQLSEKEIELAVKLQEAKMRLENLDRELASSQGEYASRVLVKFELDLQRNTLLGLIKVNELSTQDRKSQSNVTVSGEVRCVCDPARCGWLDVPPAAGETWSCTWGRSGMIGRDKKDRPIIVVNPQVKIESREAIEAEIETIQAEIAWLSDDSAASGEQVGEEVTPEMLAGLVAAFEK